MRGHFEYEFFGFPPHSDRGFGPWTEHRPGCGPPGFDHSPRGHGPEHHRHGPPSPPPCGPHHGRFGPPHHSPPKFGRHASPEGHHGRPSCGRRGPPNDGEENRHRHGSPSPHRGPHGRHGSPHHHSPPRHPAPPGPPGCCRRGPPEDQHGPPNCGRHGPPNHGDEDCCHRQGPRGHDSRRPPHHGHDHPWSGPICHGFGPRGIFDWPGFGPDRFMPHFGPRFGRRPSPYDRPGRHSPPRDFEGCRNRPCCSGNKENRDMNESQAKKKGACSGTNMEENLTGGTVLVQRIVVDRASSRPQSV